MYNKKKYHRTIPFKSTCTYLRRYGFLDAVMGDYEYFQRTKKRQQPTNRMMIQIRQRAS